MFASVVLATLLVVAAFVRADPTPTTPSPGEVFNTGGDCQVAWKADQSGVWTVMNIELMTGNNQQMQFLELVATVDGTQNASITFKCPDVDLNAPVYFMQFTSPYSTEVYWTGRFAIAGASGITVPAPDTELSGGQTISFGTGSILGSTPTSAPTYGESVSGSASMSTSGVASASSSSITRAASTPPHSSLSSSSALVPTATSLSTSSGMSTVHTSTSQGSAPASSTTPASSASASAAGALKADNFVIRAATALAFAALTFTLAL